MIKETDAAVFLDYFGYRGYCKTCNEPIWWLRNKRSQVEMYTVNLQEHKHAKEKQKPNMNEIKKEPGGQ